MVSERLKRFRVSSCGKMLFEKSDAEKQSKKERERSCLARRLSRGLTATGGGSRLQTCAAIQLNPKTNPPSKIAGQEGRESGGVRQTSGAFHGVNG